MINDPVLLEIAQYYVIGAIITFFTLLSSRHMLGFDIYPHTKYSRVVFFSIAWLPALIVSTLISMFTKSKLSKEAKLAAEVEKERLRKQLEDALSRIPQGELAPAQVFDEDMVVEQVEPVVQKKKKYNW